jgi:hypothetical protein
MRRAFQEEPAGLREERLAAARAERAHFGAADLIDRLTQVLGNMKPVEDVERVAGLLGDDLQVRLRGELVLAVGPGHALDRHATARAVDAPLAYRKNKPPAVVLADLVRHTPGDEGKWFAAAKDAKLFAEAVALANATPCDPKTLTRAARDFARTNPAFAAEAGLAALRGSSWATVTRSRASMSGPLSPTP